MSLLDRAGIERRVPQRGAMCLLDAVTAWDGTRISCSAAAPQPTHPLARDGQVPAIAAVEYAAQATAVHGSLVDGGQTPRAGMLAKLGELHLHTDCIPDDGEALEVRAERLSVLAAGCLYAFEVTSGSRAIASGRLMVAFTAELTP
jgi:predicted hotdog family 3-hydroxylacyl-ACP dehydratase